MNVGARALEAITQTPALRALNIFPPGLGEPQMSASVGRPAAELQSICRACSSPFLAHSLPRQSLTRFPAELEVAQHARACIGTGMI